VIDQIKQDIQERLDQVFAEADKLRRALRALDPRNSTRPPRQKAEAESQHPHREHVVAKRVRRNESQGADLPSSRRPRSARARTVAPAMIEIRHGHIIGLEVRVAPLGWTRKSPRAGLRKSSAHCS
jgi:hypothetical protein